MLTQKIGFYLTALEVSVERLDKYTQGRPDNSVYACGLRSSDRRSTQTTDDEQTEIWKPSTATDSWPKPEVERSVLGMTASLSDALRQEYDQVELDELVLDTVGVVIPTGGGAWVPTVRKTVREQSRVFGFRAGTRLLLAPESPDLWERAPVDIDEPAGPDPVGSSEVVLPLAGGPEVALGLWDTGRQEGMVFIANPDGADLKRSRGD